MSGPAANCPSCGAPVAFRWAGAVQTTCPYCSSILVRHGTDLEEVGRVSEPPPRTSRIQLGSEGRYEERSFTVVGRIAYRWGRGHWSEWHVVFSDGRSGWLSDAQEEYAVTFPVDGGAALPDADSVRPGASVFHGTTEFEVTTLTEAHYTGVEGELPFEYWDHDDVLFVDLRSTSGDFATIDYSESPPLLFVGERVSFESLRMTGLLEAVEDVAGDVRTLNCPHCGGAVTVRRIELSVNVACGSCSSILDATTPGVLTLQQFNDRAPIEPWLPLGSRGRYKGAEYEVLGFQVRTIRVEGVTYAWREYLLYGGDQGFRYLTEYDGHWNWVTPLKTLPRRSGGSRPTATVHGTRFKHFQTAKAQTFYVLGEFPWQVRVGDVARTEDFVAPPRMLSCETTEEEQVWSLGEYTDGERIREAFGVASPPPGVTGVFANQPSPHREAAVSAVRTMAPFVALLLVGFVARFALPHSRSVMSSSYSFDPGAAEQSIVVTEPFTLDGRTSNVEVRTIADVNNNWIYLSYSLLNLETGRAVDFGREISYYFGVSGGERWSEGGQRDRALVPSVPAGEYVLRIVPEGPARTTYSVRLRRDVPPISLYAATFVVLLLPVGWSSYRSAAFEASRWAESDHASD